MKIDEKGKLEADWDAIEKLTKCFDKGCKSEEAYKAKLFSVEKSNAKYFCMWCS